MGGTAIQKSSKLAREEDRGEPFQALPAKKNVTSKSFQSRKGKPRGMFVLVCFALPLSLELLMPRSEFVLVVLFGVGRVKDRDGMVDLNTWALNQSKKYISFKVVKRANHIGDRKHQPNGPTLISKILQVDIPTSGEEHVTA